MLILPVSPVIVFIQLSKMEKIELTAHKRDLRGKKVRFLRRQGITPVNLYGQGIESNALQIDTPALKKALAQAGRTSLISLKIGSAKRHNMAIVRDIQRDPVKGELVHVDFYQVRMDQKIKLSVPLVLTGKAPAVKEQGGILVHELSSLEVECLPANMPHSIELDISGLVQLDQALHVKDLRIPEGVTVLTEREKVVAKIARARIEVVEAVAAAPTEAEAEVAAEGEEKKEEAEKAPGKATEESEKRKPAAEKKPGAEKKPAA
ncbi:MAG: 50S ribosomal protein L25 [Chloroflexi bacterium]|nr:50S ribosomal protein L25 [Chloroflexota bacterium]